MKIKVGDTVIVATGSRDEKGKKGKVLKTFAAENKVLVEGINLKKKVSKDASGKKALVETEFPINASNVLFFDEKSGKGSRLGYLVKEDGSKVRIAKASGTELK